MPHTFVLQAKIATNAMKGFRTANHANKIDEGTALERLPSALSHTKGPTQGWVVC